jgi:hypothetical protein
MCLVTMFIHLAFGDMGASELARTRSEPVMEAAAVPLVREFAMASMATMESMMTTALMLFPEFSLFALGDIPEERKAALSSRSPWDATLGAQKSREL